MTIALALGIFLLLGAIVALVVPLDRIAFVLTCAFVLMITWNGLRLAGGAAGNLLMILAFGAIVAEAVIARRSVPVPAWLLAAGGGCVLAAMLNLIWPPNPTWLDQSLLSYRVDFLPPPPGFVVPRSDLLTLAKFEVCLVLVPVLIAAVATTGARVHRLIDMFVLSATINAAVGVLDFAGIPLAPMNAGDGRDAGLTLHANYLALTCTIAIPLALLWAGRGGRWRTPGVVATGVLLGGEYVSGSRAGAVTAALAVIVTVAALPSLRRALGFVLPVAAMALVPLLVLTPFGHQLLDQVRITNSTTASGSNTARSDLAHLALRQIGARPVQGVGFGVIEDAHSIYLQLLAAGGVICLASFATFIGGMWGAARRALASPERDAAAAALTAVVMWLANGVFDAQLADKYLYVVPGLLLAMSCLAAAPARVREPLYAPPRVAATTRRSLAGVAPTT